jgi:hypothetical protein
LPASKSSQQRRISGLRWRLRRPHFIQRQPAGGDNAVIQLAIRLEAQQLAAEGKAQVGRIFLGRMLPVIDADQMRRPEVIGRFFQRFAHHGIDQRLVFFQMAGRLVEGQPDLGFLLDQQELAVAQTTAATVTWGFQTMTRLKRQKRYFTSEFG